MSNKLIVNSNTTDEELDSLVGKTVQVKCYPVGSSSAYPGDWAVFTLKVEKATRNPEFPETIFLYDNVEMDYKEQTWPDPVIQILD